MNILNIHLEICVNSVYAQIIIMFYIINNHNYLENNDWSCNSYLFFA